MEDGPGPRTCDKRPSVSGRVTHELLCDLRCPVVIGDVAEDDPAKRDQIDETNSTFNGGVTDPDVPFQTIDLCPKIQQRNGPICDGQLGDIVQVCCGNHYEAACRRFGGAM